MTGFNGMPSKRILEAFHVERDETGALVPAELRRPVKAQVAIVTSVELTEITRSGSTILTWTEIPDAVGYLIGRSVE